VWAEALTAPALQPCKNAPSITKPRRVLAKCSQVSLVTTVFDTFLSLTVLGHVSQVFDSATTLVISVLLDLSWTLTMISPHSTLL
jgi:hypothetical protein